MIGNKCTACGGVEPLDRFADHDTRCVSCLSEVVKELERERNMWVLGGTNTIKELKQERDAALLVVEKYAEQEKRLREEIVTGACIVGDYIRIIDGGAMPFPLEQEREFAEKYDDRPERLGRVIDGFWECECDGRNEGLHGNKSHPPTRGSCPVCGTHRKGDDDE